MSKIKRFLRIGMVVVLTFIMSFVAGGCLVDREFRGRFIETEQWQLFRFNNDRSSYRIVRLNDQSLIVDGVLTIPSYVGNRRITGFGGVDQNDGRETIFNSRAREVLHKIIIPTRIVVSASFYDGWWGQLGDIFQHDNRVIANYIELLCYTGEYVTFAFGAHRYTFIIPNGTREVYIAGMVQRGFQPSGMTLIERSEWEEKQNV